MNDDRCGAIAEKMPLVLHGQAVWTAEEAAHLAECADCAAEWTLLRTTAGLGAAAAARLDPMKVAAGVTREVKRRRRQDRWTRGGWMTGLAAAAALVLFVATSGPQGRRVVAGHDSVAEPGAEMGMSLPLAELESLDPSQLQAVLDGLDAPLGDVAPGPAPSFGDLDDSQLERVLRSLEG